MYPLLPSPKNIFLGALQAHNNRRGCQRQPVEKVFQLLERLKLAELSKTRAMEELTKKEAETVALSKKNARLLKEATKEGRGRVKAELDKKILQDQLRAIKKHNSVLASRCREEVRLKLEEREEKGAAVEKVKTFSGRLGFLLNKMQTDEEAKVVRTEEMRKLEVQLKSSNDHLSKLQVKLDDANESNRIITQASRIKQEELETMKTRLDAITRKYQEDNATEVGVNKQSDSFQIKSEEHLIEAHSRFILDSTTSSNMVLLKGKTPHFRAWLEAHDANKFLKRAQNSPGMKEMLIEHMGRSYGMMMVQEENRDILQSEIAGRDQRIEHLVHKCALMQEKLESEEEAKRRTLLRYVHAVKQTDLSRESEVHTSSELGTIQLPESSISDEELHAIAALLRSDTSIREVSLRDNMITDDGAHALASVLAGKSNLSSIDLRGNMITHHGVRILAEALERSERVRHVYVHAGGKVEALGVGRWGVSKNTPDAQHTSGGQLASANVETICCVDCRDNNIPMKNQIDHVDSLGEQKSSHGTNALTQRQAKRGSKIQTAQTRASSRSRPMLSATGKFARPDRAWATPLGGTQDATEYKSRGGGSFPNLTTNNKDHRT